MAITCSLVAFLAGPVNLKYRQKVVNCLFIQQDLEDRKKLEKGFVAKK